MKLPQSMEALKQSDHPVNFQSGGGAGDDLLIGKPVAGILEGLTTGCKRWGRQMRCCWARFSAKDDVYRHGRPGEQSGVCVWRWSAEYANFCAPMAAIA